VDRDVVGLQDPANDLDLLEHPIDELRAVAGADEQSFDAGTEEPTLDLEAWPPADFLASMT
jgi:hypothetical protein